MVRRAFGARWRRKGEPTLTALSGGAVPPADQGARPRRTVLLDVVLATIVLLAAYGAAHRVLEEHYRVAPAIEDLFAACTGRPGWGVQPAVYALPEWTAFVERRIEYFPCDAIKDIPLYEIGITWELQKYFHLALSTWFRVLGPTLAGFITFQSASYAITCVLAYLIFRLGMGPIVAFVCAAGFLWSRSHLSMAGLPIEYSKAPWALAVVWLCGLLVVRSTSGKTVRWPARVLGLVAGIGVGFKPDLIALVPFAVSTPLLFVGGWRRRRLIEKLSAAALVITGVAVGGGEPLYRNFFSPSASILPVQVLGGQDWQTESLHASSPLYDYGVTFDDSYVTWMVNSYGRRVLHTTGAFQFFSRTMQDAASRMVVRLWLTFPGDLVLRVMAATLRVLRLNEISRSVALAGFLIVFAWNRRYGWFVAFVTVYLSAYVSLIFQHRHIFHLEFISWFLAGIVLQCVARSLITLCRGARRGQLAGLVDEARARWTRPALAAAVSLLMIAGSAGLVLAAARRYQQSQLVRLVAEYERAPREPRGVTAHAEGTGVVSLHVDGLSLRDQGTTPEAIGSDYLVLTFRCDHPGPIRVRSRFLPPVTDWANWNRQFSILCAPHGQSTLMTPVYQFGTEYRFDGFIVSDADARALLSASIMHADSRVELWPNLLMPSDWKTRQWFETMKVPPDMPVWETSIADLPTGNRQWWTRIRGIRRFF